ncbi:MAG: hypothetical protein HF314_01190 [Ignavibacteria bacterium]|jgi:hypothetical protein|nr:hypothetical protein [Ignavibacteria bacterium]MCU7501658.1 hypothetical protein [Ignavibacteria bacterium]MCU7517753.1 hypothetical protein [Ignavibacteria bacterium]
MNIRRLFFIILSILLPNLSLLAQIDETEKPEYYQMEPYNDSLFVKIQEEVFIDPPDPKAEIIVDLRDQNNQTVSIKGALYPILSFTPETRAKIVTYPFKINLLDDINYGSVFTRVISKIKMSKLIEPPRKNQIASTLFYVNPFLQVYGWERFGIPFKDDLGISIGFGTPYSAPMETNFAEANIHILGFYGGAFTKMEPVIEPKFFKNPLIATTGYQVGYVIPLGNFFEFNYQKTVDNLKQDYIESIYNGDSSKLLKLMSGSYFNWEFRYPFRTLGSSRAKLYVAKYQNEIHLGYMGRELSLAGSTFDFRFDALVKTQDRKRQYALDILVQRVASGWGFSTLALGPSIVMANDKYGKFGFMTFFVNARLKVGTSL